MNNRKKKFSMKGTDREKCLHERWKELESRDNDASSMLLSSFVKTFFSVGPSFRISLIVHPQYLSFSVIYLDFFLSFLKELKSLHELGPKKRQFRNGRSNRKVPKFWIVIGFKTKETFLAYKVTRYYWNKWWEIQVKYKIKRLPVTSQKYTKICTKFIRK